MNHALMTRLGIAAVAAAAAGGTALGAFAPQGSQVRTDRPIAIRGGLLIDATGGPPRHDQTILIRGNRIVEIGDMDGVTVPDDAEVIDASGLTVMPGLINSNQHINLNPLYPSPIANLPGDVLRARWKHTWSRAEHRAFVYLMQGVTSMRNTSGPADVLVPIKRKIDAGEIPGPRLFLGAALFMSDEHFDDYLQRQNAPSDAVSFLRDAFAYRVVTDVDQDTEPYEGSEFNYWKLLMSSAEYDGRNDFTDEEVRAFITKAHSLGKIVDVHCGGHNEGLRRMLAFDVDTLEHPFYGDELIEWDVIEGYVKKGVIVDTLLSVMINGAERAADPHRFDETLYIMSVEPSEYRILMDYRDRMLVNLRKPDEPGVPAYDPANPPDFPDVRVKSPDGDMISTGRGPSFDDLQQGLRTSKENMRRFIKAGAKFSMGTDTGAFMGFQQEDPNAMEMAYMVELGMTPMQAIQAATRNGAEALGRLDDLGTIEKGKLADVIVVAGNPLESMDAMRRVAYVIKDGIRYK